MKKLDEKELIKSAKAFCKQESGKYRKELFGVTDGKAVGTFVEHLFQNYLSKNYEMEVGSSANGLDLPSVNTDIKVTSIKQPQSSCPFKDSKQKIYGLGYNLIVFVYKKTDDAMQKKGMLEFISCTFIDKSRTADYQTTTGLMHIIENKGNADDIFAFLNDHKIPADEVTLMNIAKEILKNPPIIGYLTISNALQWRLQYSRIVTLNETIDGISPIVKYDLEIDNE
ncbi:MAG: restriction endonuclease [Prevotella sp.]|nr:restriction endonuclease [Prevotella sp.]MBR1525902.1 restriction endonuclease [Prevotella sp.]MBR1928472.1 restriction endonuclease [Paludibacteraceae bacterium]MDY6230440.1 restriction endonuclease [Prevotella sp.]